MNPSPSWSSAADHMRRRDVIKMLGLGAGLALLGSQRFHRSSNGRKRPNILMHVADDLSWSHLGFVGDPAVKTPHIDRMAAEGANFTHAFVSSSTCSPSRAAMLTGRNFWELEDGANLYGTMPANLACYPTLLAQAGYRVGRWSKGYGPGVGAAWNDWDNDPAGPRVKSFEHFLADHQKQAAEQPFVFWYGSTDPHRPYARGSGAKKGIPLDQLDMLPYWPDAPQVRGDYADYLAEVQNFDSDLGKMIAALEQAGELDNTVIIVSGDNGMPFPRCKASCYDYGTRCPLIVRWPGRVKAGQVIDDLVSYIDIAPTLLEIAGLEPHDEMTGTSLMPLLGAGRSGVIDEQRDAVFFGTEGLANTRLWPTRGLRTREHLYIRNLAPERWEVLGTLQGGPTKAHMDAHGRDPAVARLNQFAFGERPAEELYDVQADPYQLNNLAGDPAKAPVCKQLAKRLEQRLRETDDPRVQGRQPGR